ncbi:trigger factor [Beduini massiliensis]|uniref:trigger factor n=1 Tax=Beduini massiliensis TaxID=1585974 RepID=UPI00059AA3BA|nr:trigger factor [Beduini massiliensis]
MKSNWTKLEGSVGELTAEFTGAEWKKAQEEAFNKLAKNVKLDGFRPGKAPAALIKKRIPTATMLQEALEIILSKEYAALLQENNVEPIAQPELSVDSIDEEKCAVKFKVTVKPEVTLGQYKDLDIKKAAVRVTQKEIQAELETLRNEFAVLETKEEGTVENGDTAVIDFEGFLDGVAFEGGKGESHPLEIGSGSFIPGFEEQVIGMNTNETKDITVTFPEEYQAPELAGKEVVFKVTVHEIKRKILPELDDELAKDTNIEKVETLKDLEAHVKAQLKSQKTTKAENEYSEALFKQVVENATVDVPEVMVEQEMQQMLQEIMGNLQQQGLDFETFKAITGKTTEDIKEEIKEQAESRVKLNLVLAEIVKAEKLEVTEEEMNQELENIANYYGKDVEEVKTVFAGQMGAIASDILNRKAIKVIKGE